MRLAILVELLLLVSVCSFAIEGYGVFGPVSVDTVNPSLLLHAPNGGEIWRGGNTYNLRWTASDNHFGLAPIDIYYSVDGGPATLLYNSVTNTGTIPWRLPWLYSDMALVQIRATDQFGNTDYVESAAYFTIYANYPLAPEGLTISVENGSDILLIWQPVTLTVDGSPVVPDGYLVLGSANPSNEQTDYVVLADCSETTYTHENAVLDWPHYFYSVLAYTNDGSGVITSHYPSIRDLAPKTTSPEQIESFQPDEENLK